MTTLLQSTGKSNTSGAKDSDFPRCSIFVPVTLCSPMSYFYCPSSIKTAHRCAVPYFSRITPSFFFLFRLVRPIHAFYCNHSPQLRQLRHGVQNLQCFQHNRSCNSDRQVSSGSSGSNINILSMAVVWTARTYAVYDKNKIILIYFSCLGLACIAIDIVRDCLTPMVFQV